MFPCSLREIFQARSAAAFGDIPANIQHSETDPAQCGAYVTYARARASENDRLRNLDCLVIEDFMKYFTYRKSSKR